jgi:GNAT superfamily N-acetyltransferase
MSQVLVRPPRMCDGEGAAQAWLDFAEYYTKLDPEAFQIPRNDGLAEWIEQRLLGVYSPDDFVRVAEMDGEVVGFVDATFLPPDSEAPWQLVREVVVPRVFVNALAVQARHWRAGIGTRLMTAVEEWGRARQARLIVLDTYSHSPISVPFYEQRMEYTRQSLRFAKRL